MSLRFNTIQDMVAAQYGPNGQEVVQTIMKVDAPVLTSTTGVNNVIYGAKAWELVNLQANTLGVLPKQPLQNAGYRVITAIAGTAGQGGVAENGALPDTVKPTWATADITVKQVAHTFDMSLVQELSAKSGDDSVGFEQMREYFARQHASDMNVQLLGDADTLAGDNLESVDRVASNQSEETALLTAGDSDIYGFDRSAATDYDAYVDHNSGTDRALTTAMIRTAIDTVTENSGDRPNVIITGFDTARDIDALFETQTRYETLRVTVGMNGIQTAAGNDVGLQVQSVYGIPLIRDKDVQKDTKSRVYFLNTEYLFLGIRLATTYFESNDYFANNRLGREGMYLTVGELVCTRLNAQGKIRDLL